MTKISSFLQKQILKLDYFSNPIQFTLGPHETSKSSIFGGMMTILIALLSFMYFVYVCNLYITNQIQPSIIVNDEQIESEYEIEFPNEMIGFRIFIKNGLALQDLESKRGRYVSYLVDYSYYIKKQTKKYTAQFLATPCKSDQLKGFMCIDLKSKITSQQSFESLKLKYTDEEIPQNTIRIYTYKCQQDQLPPGEYCQTHTGGFDYDKVVYELETVFQVKTILKKFNPNTKQYEFYNKIENFLFDEKLAFSSAFSFQNTQTRIIDGFIIQSTNIENNISDYQKTVSYISQSKIIKETNKILFGVITCDLYTNVVVQTVQYAQFTSLLAQFFSVLSSLLVLGVICNIFSQTEIVQDLLNIQLRVYYKKTALDIMKSSEKFTNTNYEQLNQYKLLKSIQKTDMRTKIPDYTKLGLIQRLKILLSFKTGSQKEQTGSKEVKVYKSLLQKSVELLDIYHIQEELLKIQMMLRLIFSAEQYAAIQMCGCEIVKDKQLQIEKIETSNLLQKQIIQAENIKLNMHNIQNTTHNNKQNEIQKVYQNSYNNNNTQLNPRFCEIIEFGQKEQDQNHLETIELIERDEIIQQQYIDKFLINNQFPKSELDKRIIQSMIGINNPIYQKKS